VEVQVPCDALQRVDHAVDRDTEFVDLQEGVRDVVEEARGGQEGTQGDLPGDLQLCGNGYVQASEEGPQCLHDTEVVHVDEVHRHQRAVEIGLLLDEEVADGRALKVLRDQLIPGSHIVEQVRQCNLLGPDPILRLHVDVQPQHGPDEHDERQHEDDQHRVRGLLVGKKEHHDDPSNHSQEPQGRDVARRQVVHVFQHGELDVGRRDPAARALRVVQVLPDQVDPHPIVNDSVDVHVHLADVQRVQGEHGPEDEEPQQRSTPLRVARHEQSALDAWQELHRLALPLRGLREEHVRQVDGHRDGEVQIDVLQLVQRGDEQRSPPDTLHAVREYHELPHQRHAPDALD